MGRGFLLGEVGLTAGELLLDRAGLAADLDDAICVCLKIAAGGGDGLLIAGLEGIHEGLEISENSGGGWSADVVAGDFVAGRGGGEA